MASTLEGMVPLLARVRQWCAQQALPELESQRIELVLEELVSNTVSHGYGGRADGWVEVHLERAGDEWWMTLSDGAPVFDPTRGREISAAATAALAASVEDQAIGGLGLAMVRQWVDAWEHTPLASGNRLRLRRRIAPAQRPR
jgi:serine/threonine-protein kinase RsbW